MDVLKTRDVREKQSTPPRRLLEHMSVNLVQLPAGSARRRVHHLSDVFGLTSARDVQRRGGRETSGSYQDRSKLQGVGRIGVKRGMYCAVQCSAGARTGTGS